MDKRNIVLFLLVSVIFIIIIISLLLFNLNKNSGGSLSSQNVYNYDVVRTSINDINLDTIKANSSEIKSRAIKSLTSCTFNAIIEKPHLFCVYFF